jgi:hypothetical protein
LSEFEYIVGNPPYVPIEELSELEKTRYKTVFDTAQYRFDLYLLFFERALELLTGDGRLVYVTPEKFEYVATAEPLRRILTNKYSVQRLEHLREDRYSGRVTYPTVTTVGQNDRDQTRIHRRDGSTEEVRLPRDGQSWAATLRHTDGKRLDGTGITLGDITVRVSPGIATGRDGVFVMRKDKCPPQLIEGGWIYPTVSGQQLESHGIDGPDVMICPYNDHGQLIAENQLDAFGDWAQLHREKLESRSCVSAGKPWYSYHENPPLADILRPKIMWRDVTKEPKFWIDEDGGILPRHTVYYAVPHDQSNIHCLSRYLNSVRVDNWIRSNAQKARGNYLRLQSQVLKKLPISEEW